jgi:hypothetical protein
MVRSGPMVRHAAADGQATRPGRRRQGGFDPGPAWMRVLPPLVMLAVGLAGVDNPHVRILHRRR